MFSFYFFPFRTIIRKTLIIHFHKHDIAKQYLTAFDLMNEDRLLF